MAALLPQIEDLSQQAHKAAAEKFKVPVTSSPLAPPAPPSLTIKEESEDEVEEVLAGDAVTLPRPVKRPCKTSLSVPSRWTTEAWSRGTSSW